MGSPIGLVKIHLLPRPPPLPFAPPLRVTKTSGPDGAVFMSSVNGLVGTGFVYYYYYY